MRKALLTYFKPLAAWGTPPPHDLSTWWSEVEAGLKSIHEAMSNLHDPMYFGHSHVINLGPIILGMDCWN